MDSTSQSSQSAAWAIVGLAMVISGLYLGFQLLATSGKHDEISKLKGQIEKLQNNVKLAEMNLELEKAKCDARINRR